MPVPDRKQMESLYHIFNSFTLNDQRNYYQRTLDRYRKSTAQVNTIRAMLSLLTGLSSALAGLIVQSIFINGACAPNAFPTISGETGFCENIKLAVSLLMVIAVVAPALGGAFGTLADLFQWDRLVTIYDVSLENIEVADASSPDTEMDDMTYWASLRAFTEGTLNVMRDETAQWGQLIRTPEQVEKFIASARADAEKAAERPSDSTTPPEPGGTAQ
jgi:hypothetical protein